MKTIFGMPIFPKRPKTDAEFVEQVRRSIPLQRRLALIHAVIVIFWICLFTAGYRWFLGAVREYELAAASDGVAIGLVCGLVLGLGSCYCFAAVGGFIESLAGDRKAKLLVKLYDETVRSKGDT